MSKQKSNYTVSFSYPAVDAAREMREQVRDYDRGARESQTGKLIEEELTKAELGLWRKISWENRNKSNIRIKPPASKNFRNTIRFDMLTLH